MLNDLKENEPKTYIIISLALIMVVFVVIGFSVYLTAITRYLELGLHIISAAVGIIFCCLGVLMIINIMGKVSKLRTKLDWEEERKEGQAKLKFQLETRKMEVLLEKLKVGEVLTLAEHKQLEDLETLELETKGDPS